MHMDWLKVNIEPLLAPRAVPRPGRIRGGCSRHLDYLQTEPGPRRTTADHGARAPTRVEGCFAVSGVRLLPLTAAIPRLPQGRRRH